MDFPPTQVFSIEQRFFWPFESRIHAGNAKGEYTKQQ
jgi:hypothetical protein